MDASIPHLDQLMVALSEKTGYPLDTQGLKDMSEAIGLKEKYLYEYIYRKKEKAREQDESHISVQPSKLNTMAKFTGHKNYQAFVMSIEKPVDPILLSLAGTYYSYVRRNDDQGYILRSPVRIYETCGKIILELKGPMRLYTGEVKLRHGCLFIVLEEEAGKQMHHVYKIGTRQKPDVLQGIFSGVSTNFDPIGGRTVLVRNTIAFDKLQGKEGNFKEFSESGVPAEKSIAKYFKDYAANNLRINRVVGFGEADLDG
jgi:hypothetical protein